MGRKDGGGEGEALRYLPYKVSCRADVKDGLSARVMVQFSIPTRIPLAIQ